MTCNVPSNEREKKGCTTRSNCLVSGFSGNYATPTRDFRRCFGNNNRSCDRWHVVREKKEEGSKKRDVKKRCIDRTYRTKSVRVESRDTGQVLLTRLARHRRGVPHMSKHRHLNLDVRTDIIYTDFSLRVYVPTLCCYTFFYVLFLFYPRPFQIYHSKN